MRFQFCSIRTIPSAIRELIYDKMTWTNGAMREWLDHNEPGIRLCLLYDARLISWASWDSKSKVGTVAAWTILKHRRCGYARQAIEALLRHHGVGRRRRITVWSEKTYAILKRLGYSNVRNKYFWGN